MALIVRLLGAGATNANANTVLYSASPTVLGAVVNNIRFVNTGGADVTVNLFVNPSGSVGQLRILDKDLVAPNSVGVLVVKPELTLGPSDAIEVTTSAAMDYVVSGAERT